MGNKKTGFIHRGHFYPCGNSAEIQALRKEHPGVWAKARTRNAEVIRALYADYLRELDSQDQKGSCGSYGKMAEVSYRVQSAIERGAAVSVHDVRCRPSTIADIIRDGRREEYKTGCSADWCKCTSREEGMQKLLSSSTLVHWDVFCDGREWTAPMSEIMGTLAQYSPKKGLAVWFNSTTPNGQLKMQPVTGSARRRLFLEDVLRRLEEEGRL